MTKNDRLTIAPEQARGRWYHLFVENDNGSGKIVYTQSDNIFTDSEKSGHILAQGVPAPVAELGEMYANLYAETADSVTVGTSGLVEIPLYTKGDTAYTKGDNYILFNTTGSGTSIFSAASLFSTDLPGVLLSATGFSISAVVQSNVQTTDNAPGGIKKTWYEDGVGFTIAFTSNFESCDLWIYGGFE